MLPLVLIPGMMCDARLYGPQIAAMSGRRTLCLAPMAEDETVDAMAEAILATAPPRFALAGLSMGGIVAMAMVARATDRIARLALLDTNPLAERPEIAARRERQITAVEAGDLVAVMRDEMKPNYLTDGPRRSEILDLCMRMALDLGPKIFVRQSRALRDRPDRQETLAAVRMPTLIVCGADDRLCPVERHTMMHRLIAGSRLTVIEGAGHLPTLEQPETTTAELTRWLEE